MLIGAQVTGRRRQGHGGVRRRAVAAFFSVMMVALLSSAALASPTSQSMTMVVHRGDRSVEVYLSLPAEQVTDTFAVLPEGLTTGDGTVDIETMRMGTWDIGDRLFSSIASHVSGQPVVFEAMSLMVHPEEDVLPFSDPIEGMIAISVCSVPVPDKPPALEDLHLYVGLITYPERPDGPLSLTFPTTGREQLEVQVIEYVDFRRTSRSVHLIADGGELTVPAVSPRARQGLWPLGLGAALVAAVALAMLLGRGQNRFGTVRS